MTVLRGFLVGALLVLSACLAPHRMTSLIPHGSPPPQVRGIVSAVSPTAVKGYVDKLVSFGTRHTLSDATSDTRGIGAARRWIKGKFEEFAARSNRSGEERIKVYFDSHLRKKDDRRITRDVDIVNVVMEIPGSMPEARNRRYYVIGHYDSIPSKNTDSASDAPGADDDGSGTAVVLELARVLAGRHFDSTIVLMATAGEEQGLFGARHHAALAKDKGWDIRAVLNNDIVGDPSSPSGKVFPGRIRVFSEGVPANATDRERRMYRRFGTCGDSPSRQLARFVAEVAHWENTAVKPMLIFRADRFGRGGDHSAFNHQGFAGIRFCELFETYTRQHQDVRVEDGIAYGDQPEFVDGRYLANVTRLNGAVLIHLANAPSSPKGLGVRGRTAHTTLRWEPSPEPDVAGYEVVWRATTSPVWQFVRDVGTATGTTLDVSRDNHYFGVRAYDQAGYRSPVSFSDITRPRRRQG